MDPAWLKNMVRVSALVPALLGMPHALAQGADLQDVFNWRASYSTPVDHSVSWTLTLVVRDSADTIVPDADVRIYDQHDQLAASLRTDNAGVAQIELIEYHYSYGSTATYTYSAPYRVEVTKQGVGQHTASIELSFPTQLPVTLR